MFVAHAVPLPGFLFLYSDLSARFGEYSDSPSALGSIPVMWLLLAVNTLLQYTCLRSVYKLQTLCSSLTVTLVITIRKFVSLVFSIVYFQNPFTPQHWLGAALVFLGALMFSEVIVMPKIGEKKKTRSQ
jgi:UDP-xylose/UDP-N-acetylglucosamine transporter B4